MCPMAKLKRSLCLSRDWKRFSMGALLSCTLLFPIRSTAHTGIPPLLDGFHKPPKYRHSLSDTIPVPSSKRLPWVAGITSAGFAGSLIVLNEAWYKEQGRSSFHVFNDSKEWLQVDKVGHGWSAYNAARATGSLWRWAGLSQKKAAWMGGISSFAYMTGIEVLDGFAEKWGWSWSDVAANSFGVGLYLAQEIGWKEQRIQFKFSFHRNRYDEAMLEERADDLFGAGFAERMLKDYNAQTYWLSANIRSFFPESAWPAWLNLSLGYGATGMFGGFENSWMDEGGQPIVRNDIRRTRQFYFSPDIDFTRIPTNSKFLRTVFSMLNAFKFPAPALMLDSRGKWKAVGMMF